jgi:hypothetical protein
MKRKNQRLLLLLALAATLAFALTSCQLWQGPTVIEKWWNDQQPKR